MTSLSSSTILFYAHRKGQGSLKFAKKNDDGDDDEDANDSGTAMLPLMFVFTVSCKPHKNINK